MMTHGIICFDKKKFWLYGIRFFEFEKALDFKNDERDEVQVQEEMVPKNAFYNDFF